MENKEEITIEIPLSEHDAAVKNALKLRFIENWLKEQDGYTDINPLKKLLDLVDDF